jgi:hypothetical protein
VTTRAERIERVAQDLVREYHGPGPWEDLQPVILRLEKALASTDAAPEHGDGAREGRLMERSEDGRRGYLQGYAAGVQAACAALPCEISDRCRCPSMAVSPCESCAAYHRIQLALPAPALPLPEAPLRAPNTGEENGACIEADVHPLSIRGVEVVDAMRAAAPPSSEPRREEDEEESEDNFCADPCGGLLYLAASAGSAWVATCGSCGKTWPQQPWVHAPPPAPAPAPTADGCVAPSMSHDHPDCPPTCEVRQMLAAAPAPAPKEE